MKRLLFFWVLLFWNLQAEAGEVITDRSMRSDILNKTIRYSVYLPDGYGSSTTDYPVLYLLHGLGDDHTAWVVKGDLLRIADSLIRSGEIVPMVIVTPDAWDSWYVNDYAGTCCYEDMFFKEFMPYVESTYRVRREQKNTFISGLSMGGNASLMYTFRHPDRFGVCGALSPAVLTDEEMEQRALFSDLFQRLFGNPVKWDHYRGYSAIDLARHLPESDKQKVDIYVDCGDDDFLYKGNDALHTALRDSRIRSEYRMRDGGHTWEYWRTGLPEILRRCTSSSNR